VDSTVLPTGEPLIGGFVRLDVLTEADLPELYPILGDPGIYTAGYVMHRRPTSVDDAVALARERFMAGQGAADGRGGGRTAYAIRLVADTESGRAGTLVGTSSLAEATSSTRASISARRSTAASGGALRSTPRPSSC
jgi:hypothetical protein